MTGFMSLEEANICNYADDTTIYACCPKIETVITHLEHDTHKITEWFPNNYMKLNVNDCHIIFFWMKGDNEITIKIAESCVKESRKENFLGITFDKSLSFKKHINTLCRKASQKLHALAHISVYLDTGKCSS